MIMELMKDKLGVEVSYTLGAHNMAYPFVDRGIGKNRPPHRLSRKHQRQASLEMERSALYAGALYAIRHPDRTYEVLEVNNAYKDGKPTLVSPRTLCRSPYGDKGIFIGGHDASRKISDDMAWIFHASEEVALGRKRGGCGTFLQQSKTGFALTRRPALRVADLSCKRGSVSTLDQAFP